ncbi:MAG: right-handed parallel beta-helix repeat-containing protein, partial [Woeseiaceae bacterium]
NVLDNFTRAGVLASGEGASVHVKGNRIEGPDDPRVWAPNGIQISRGSHGVVLDNEVTNIPSPVPPSGAGSGIILFCSGKATVQGNRVANADIGIAIADTEGASVLGNEVRDANFDAISLQFLGFVFGPLGCPNDPAPSPVRKNLVNNNVLLDSDDAGISLVNFDDTTLSDQPSDNLISNNQIEDSGDDGIHVFNTVGNPSDNSFVKNVIRESGDTDAVDETMGDGTAGTANDWHANRCPTDNPDGLCQKPPKP